jgi:sugar phosphate isomerase/epimerase
MPMTHSRSWCVRFPAIFQELKNQGYKGNFSIEHEANWNNNAGDVVEIVKFI